MDLQGPIIRCNYNIIENQKIYLLKLICCIFTLHLLYKINLCKNIFKLIKILYKNSLNINSYQILLTKRFN
jgi:hypothetical protein